jgi:WD repeat-containing protein 61
MKPQVRARFTGHKGPVYALEHGPRPGTFLSGSGDGQVVVWDLEHPDRGELLVNVGQPVFSLHLDAERGRLYIGTDSGSLHVIDLQDRKEIQLLQAQHKGLYAIHPLGGDRVLCAAGDGTLAVYLKGPVLTLQRAIPLCDGKLRGLATNATDDLLAVACGDGTVRVLDTVDLNEHHTLAAHDGGALCAGFHPTKPALLTGGKDGHLRLWHAADDYRELMALPAHKAAIYRIAFNAAGSICATASRDKTAKRWDADTFEPLDRLDRAAGGHGHSVDALLWMQDVLLTAGDDRTILAWS